VLLTCYSSLTCWQRCSFFIKVAGACSCQCAAFKDVLQLTFISCQQFIICCLSSSTAYAAAAAAATAGIQLLAIMQQISSQSLPTPTAAMTIAFIIAVTAAPSATAAAAAAAAAPAAAAATLLMLQVVAAAQALLLKGVRHVLVTLADRRALLVAADGSVIFQEALPVPGGQVVDGTAAGL
jgi:hypothetical protein